MLREAQVLLEQRRGHYNRVRLRRTAASQAARAFIGTDCTLCTDKAWKVQKKKLD
jgi:hypothetical protein